MGQALLTQKEMADRLGISKRTLAYMQDRKEIPYIRLSSRLVRYNEDDVMMSLMTNNRIGPVNTIPAKRTKLTMSTRYQLPSEENHKEPVQLTAGRGE